MNKDSKIVEQQIGRKLRTDSEVSCRCHFNIPAVIKVPPKLDDGTPFPTTYWLTCPMYNKKIGSLESHGLIKELDKEIINIWPDEEFISINKVVEICSNLTGFNSKPIFKKDRPREVRHALCSADKARKLLNYKTNTSLNEGINQTLEYIKKRGVRPFDYNIELEIVNDLTPETWKNKEI